MQQPSKNIIKKSSSKNRKSKITDKRLPPKQRVIKKKNHPDFGTSMAEQQFAKDFLDKLGINYVWQFEAKEIHRFFDFYCVDYNVIIEYNGSYYHSDPRLYEEKDLNPMQKKARRIDEEKKSWAILHKIPIIYIWEKDVNEHPDKVMDFLRGKLKVQENILEKERNMNKRHVNMLKNVNYPRLKSRESILS